MISKQGVAQEKMRGQGRISSPLPVEAEAMLTYLLTHLLSSPCWLTKQLRDGKAHRKNKAPD